MISRDAPALGAQTPKVRPPRPGSLDLSRMNLGDEQVDHHLVPRSAGLIGFLAGEVADRGDPLRSRHGGFSDDLDGGARRPDA